MSIINVLAMISEIPTLSDSGSGGGCGSSAAMYITVLCKYTVVKVHVNT